MRSDIMLAGLAAASGVTARSFQFKHHGRRQDDANPFTGRTLTPNPEWAEKLEPTYESFIEAGDEVNAGKVRTIQDTGTFFWVSNLASLPAVDDAIEAARAQKEETGEDQIVGLVVYNLPDRDCSAGESAGELSGQEGLERYKTEYIAPYAEKVAEATDVTFALVLEPDALANLVTNMGVELCQEAEPIYKEGIAHAIAELQFDHVHLYVDVAHGGWLGWDDNLAPTASLIAEVLELAREQSGTDTKIRGVVTNVSNYNPFIAEEREDFTEFSNSWDEYHYAESLAPHLEEAGVPANFIIDQGRVAEFGAREEWGDWCNVSPAGFGQLPGSSHNSTLVDSIVWVKPGGESDGECGLEGAPIAGAWFPEYVEMLVEYAHPTIQPAE